MKPWRIIALLLLLFGLDASAFVCAPKNASTGFFGVSVSRARYYSPQIGRFWTMDTFEGNQTDPLSLHKYLYCTDNPVNLRDPSGHFVDGLSTLFSTALNFFMTARDAARVEAGRKQAQVGIGLATLLVTMNIVMTYEYGGFDSADAWEIMRQQTQRRVDPTRSSHSYKNKECDLFADDAMKFFTKQKKNPKRIIYDSLPNKTTGDNIFALEGFGFLGGQNISVNGHHEGVLVDGAVFDNNVPFGVPRDMWESSYLVRPLDWAKDLSLREAHTFNYGVIREE